MRHQQILDKLAASRDLLQAMEQDLALWTCDVMSGGRGSDAAMRERFLPPIMARWRCLLDADDVRIHTKNKAWVALATLLHKYGFLYEHITARALAAIDDLNKDVILSDVFARQSEDIKAFLQSAPPPLARRPRRPKPMTFLRVGDVVSIQLDGQFHAACVLDLHRDSGGTLPVIEFYEGRFERIPTAENLSGRVMAREHGRGRFGVIGLSYLPDPANQVVAVATGIAAPPRGAPPTAHDGHWILTDLIRLQDYIRKFCGGARQANETCTD